MKNTDYAALTKPIVLGFERDTYWKPMITEKEVIEYSRVNCWDEKENGN